MQVYQCYVLMVLIQHNKSMRTNFQDFLSFSNDKKH